MRAIKKIPVFLLTMILCIGLMAMPAFAASSSQDGLEVTFTTDKESYSQSEQIVATLTVTNTNDFAVSNVSLENVIPEGYTLAEGNEATKQVESLEAGETVSLTVTYVPGNTGNGGEQPGTGDNTGNTDTPGSGDNGGSTEQPGTGNDSGSSSNTGTGSNNTTSGNGTSGSGSNNSGTSPTTGDDSNVALWIALLVLASTGLVTLTALRKKSGKKLLSLFLCVAMVGTMIPLATVRAYAAGSQKSISLSQNISVGFETVILEAIVNYDVVDGALVDSDGDGLIDIDEDALGTDPLNPDTDGDGLTDYEEVILGTDPLTKNEYDKMLDSDSDGLTDIDEVQNYGTDPYSDDTDSDGLSDYDEIYLYGTNPLNPDTDADTLSDGFEIEHELDPNKDSTDGITNDGELKIEQTISDIGISLTLRDETNLAKPSISGAASGELSDNVFLAMSTDSAFDDIRAVIGEAVYVDGRDDYVDGLTLTFDVTSYKGSLDDLVIVTLNEDGNFDVVESTLTGSVLSCQIPKSGTYCVLDLEEFLGSLGFDLSSYWDSYDVSAISTYSLESNDDIGENANAIIVDEFSSYLTQTEDLATEVSNISAFEEDDIDNSEEDVNVSGAGESSVDASEKTVDGSDGADNAFETEKSDMNVSEEAVENAEEDTDTSAIEEFASAASYSVISEPEEYVAQINDELLEELNETNAALLSSTVSGQADIVFAIDTTGSMSSTINNVVTNVTSFATTLSENYNVKVNYALIDFKDLEEDGKGTTVVVKNGSSNWFSDVNAFVDKVSTLTATGGGDSPECDIDALETARRLNFRSSASKFIILITDASYKAANDYGIESMTEEIELLKADGIITSVVTSSSYKSTYQSLYESTGGIYANISSSTFSASLLALADLIGETTSDGTWVILKHGYRYVKLTDETDQDGDGLSTTYELNSEEEIDLSLLIKAQLALHGVPYSDYSGKTSITVYNAKSDPTRADTDGDGIMDKEDTAPWVKGMAGGIIGTIQVCASDKGYAVSSLWNTGGHGWLVYKSYVIDSIPLNSALYATWNGENFEYSKIGDLAVSKDEVITIGSWGNKDEACVYVNLELLFGSDAYKDYYSLCHSVTNSQLEKLCNHTQSNDYWTATKNCSYYASCAWNAMFNDDLSAKQFSPLGMICTPKHLANNIKKRDGWLKNADFGSDEVGDHDSSSS